MICSQLKRFVWGCGAANVSSLVRHCIMVPEPQLPLLPRLDTYPAVQAPSQSDGGFAHEKLETS